MSNADRIINATFAALSIPTNGYKSAAEMMDKAYPIVRLTMKESKYIDVKYAALNAEDDRESECEISQKELDAVANLIEAIAQKDEPAVHENVVSIEMWLGCDLSVYIKTKESFRSLVNIL